jgi:hypothetical protein
MGSRFSKNNTNGRDEQQQPQQLRQSSRKRKLNELATDGKQEGEENQIQQEEGSSSKTKREEKNDQDLEVFRLAFNRKRKAYLGSNSKKLII